MSKFYKHKTNSKVYYISILKRLYPEIVINKIKKVHGYDSVVLIINQNRLFKIPQRKDVIDQYLLEEKIYPFIRNQCSIEVPRILEIRKGWQKKFDEFVVEYEIMRGNHLTLEIEKNNFSDLVFKNIGQQIGKYLSQLHSLDIESLINLGITKFDQKKWHKEYDFVKENCFALWNDKQQEFVDKLYKDFLKIWDLQSFSPVLNHGDLGNWHIFSDKQSIIGFIDWGGIKIDDPAFDIKWHESDNNYDKIIGEEIINQYKKNHKIDPYFFARTYFYKKRSAVSKFIKGIKFNDNQRIQDGYKLLHKTMKNG